MRARAIAVVVCATLLLAGCAVTSDPVRDAREAGVSAAGSAAIAVGLRDGGGATAPLTDTTLSDALRELTDASRDLVELTASDPAEQQERDAVEHALREAMDAVTGTRAALARGDDLGPWRDELIAARDALEEAGG